MTVSDMHYELERRWNMNTNAHRPGLTDLEKDSALHHGQRDLVLETVHDLRIRGLSGTERNQYAIERIQSLMAGWPEEPPLPMSKIRDRKDVSVYRVDPEDTQQKYLSFVSGNIETDCGVFGLHIAKASNLMESLNTTHIKPSRTWKRALCIFVESGIHLYLPKSVTPSGFCLSYVHEPPHIRLGTYADQAGNLLPETPPALPETFHDDVVKYAIRHLSTIYGDQVMYQMSTDIPMVPSATKNQSSS